MNIKGQEAAILQASELSAKSNSKSKSTILMNSGLYSSSLTNGDQFEQYNVESINISMKGKGSGLETVNQKSPVINSNNCMHFLFHSLYITSIQQVIPSYNQKINYYKEFWRVYLQNEVLVSQMREHVVQGKDIQARITQSEVLAQL